MVVQKKKNKKQKQTNKIKCEFSKNKNKIIILINYLPRDRARAAWYQIWNTNVIVDEYFDAKYPYI